MPARPEPTRFERWRFGLSMTVAPFLATQVAWAYGLSFWGRLGAGGGVMFLAFCAEVVFTRRRHTDTQEAP